IEAAETVQVEATLVLTAIEPVVVVTANPDSDEIIKAPTKHVNAVVDLANDIFDFFKLSLVLINSSFINRLLNLF
ncbi:MAG: hypothetical protein RLZZ530_135, partial [Pseudomonadota bacterium]